MNDKQIRRILIEYLKATNAEIRIYQEKHIGSSVCDLMTVTDCLTGYEIKSDLDNYTRLHAQVHAYDAFLTRIISSWERATEDPFATESLNIGA